MEATEKVSIVVPVYNVAPYLSRCVDSLLGQTYPNVQIVLVDDCSKDNSRQIIARYAEQDERICPVYQEQNQGVSAARNRGLDACVGEWIGFCDGDDWFAPDFLEKMLACAAKEQADYLICNYQIVSDFGAPIVSGSISALLDQPDTKLVIACGPTSSCTHLVRREVFAKANVRYPVGLRQNEELPVIPVLAKYADKIAVLNEPLYNYYQRGDGTSASNIASGSEQNFFTGWNLMRQALGEGYEAEAEYHAIYALFYGEILSLCKQKATKKAILEKIREYKAQFPRWESNPYLPYMGSAKNLFLQLFRRNCVIGLRLLAWVHQKIVK